jgi:predicted ATPase
MRIAISGAHGTGKSTLLELLVERLPEYAVVEEPYQLLLDDGHDFSDQPEAEDFVAQLARSIEALEEPATDVIFDRCPADFIAYLTALGADAAEWLPQARAALQTLDLIVFVPIETPDRIALAEEEDLRLRRKVDRALQELLLDDELEAGIDVLVVTGSPEARVDTVLQRVGLPS